MGHVKEWPDVRSTLNQTVFKCSSRTSFVCSALLLRWLRVKDVEFEEIFIALSSCAFLLPPSFT